MAATTRDRQVVAIAAAHLRGERDLVDALAREHLVDHPDNVLVAWIAGASHAPPTTGAVMNRKLTAILLVLAAVLANLGFTALGSIFNYPDVLDEPAGKVLAAFRDDQGAVSGWFVVLALAAALLAPVAIGVGRLSTSRAMRIAVPVGIAAAVVQVIGLLRWPILVPGYASDAASADPGVAAAARDSFTTASDILGTAIGETLGYLLTATWTRARRRRARPPLRRALVPGARRGGRGARPRRRALAARPAGVDAANFLGYVLWSVVADRLRGRDPRPRAPPRERAGRGDGMTALTDAGARRRSRGSGARLRWLPTFAGFPLGGLLAELVVGPVDASAPALAGGAITGFDPRCGPGLGLGPTGCRRAPGPAPRRSASPPGWRGCGGGRLRHRHGRPRGPGRALRPRSSGRAGGGAARRSAARVPVGARARRDLGARVDDHAASVSTSRRQYTVFGSSGALVVTPLTAVLPALLAVRRSGAR